MKYYNYQITTSEIPDEITLCINITGCPIHCADCHSKFLWEDTGEELTKETLSKILDKSKGVSCVCFMGGDADYTSLAILVSSVFVWNHSNKQDIKVALYSGRSSIQELLDLAGVWIKTLDYIKVGPYIEEMGSIDKKTTNQRLYKISPFAHTVLASTEPYSQGVRVYGTDITTKFWKRI